MGHRSAPLDRELHLEICDRARRGEPLKAIAVDCDVSPETTAKWTAHLPRGDRRDLVRASILERALAGDSLDCIASLEACTMHFVGSVVRAYFAEVHARLTWPAPGSATSPHLATKARPEPFCGPPEPPRKGSLIEHLRRMSLVDSRGRPRVMG